MHNNEQQLRKIEWIMKLIKIELVGTPNNRRVKFFSKGTNYHTVKRCKFTTGSTGALQRDDHGAADTNGEDTEGLADQHKQIGVNVIVLTIELTWKIILVKPRGTMTKRVDCYRQPPPPAHNDRRRSKQQLW